MTHSFICGKIENLFKLLFAIFLISFFFAFFTTYSLFSIDYEPNTVVVKFKSNSTSYNDWLKSGRQGLIPGLTEVIGAHTSTAYICDALIESSNTKKPSIQSADNSNRLKSIQKICIIRYESSIDPLILAGKLSSNPDIEYAEVLPVPYFSFIPNDKYIESQYYLRNIKAFEAWDALVTTDTLIVGIVDTGVDYLHIDLAANVYENPGETGLDNFGNDKRTNGIDDDGNGYIDDWHGWDFVSTSIEGDNDPKPGNMHGTHVAGTVGAITNNTIGVAGAARNVKIMPVKVGADDPNTRSVSRGYEGILYAAENGAKVINCSWGASNRSNAEQEIISTCTALGAVIVAAAGNDGAESAQYPASYYGVLSVASVDSDDHQSWFSNYHSSIDVSAPGENILNLSPGGGYESLDGTSMASPIAASVVALARLAHPEYSAEQIVEHVKFTSDNVDTKNPGRAGKIGTGRVNALRAVTQTDATSTIIKSSSTHDKTRDGEFSTGHEISLDIIVKNVLAPIVGGYVKFYADTNINFTLIKDSIYIGSMAMNEEKVLSDVATFIVPDGILTNRYTWIRMEVCTKDKKLSTDYSYFTLNPTYKTFSANNIHVTVNSRGNFGFNDYPRNLQGSGFSYIDSNNLLFEGAVIAGSSEHKISDAARIRTGEQTHSFASSKTIESQVPGSIAHQEGDCMFSDLNQSFDAGISVRQHIYQFDAPEAQNFIITTYDIINITTSKMDSLYFALFFDWDIGPSGSNNEVYYDFKSKSGFAKNSTDKSYPYIGVKLLSKANTNFFAIDNTGSTNDNPGINPDFPRVVKWRMISSGISRAKSSITDASMLIGAGPLKLQPNDTIRVSFSIFGDKNEDGLRQQAQSSQELADANNLSDGSYLKLPQKDSLELVAPIPVVADYINISFSISEDMPVTLELLDIMGRRVAVVYDNQLLKNSRYFETIMLNPFSSGIYYLRLKTNSLNKVVTVPVLR